LSSYETIVINRAFAPSEQMHFLSKWFSKMTLTALWVFKGLRHGKVIVRFFSLANP